MKIKAAVLYERNTPLIVEEIDLDPPADGEVLVKIAGSGVCHSDLREIKGGVEGRLFEGSYRIRARGSWNSSRGWPRRLLGQSRRPRGAILCPKLRHMLLLCHWLTPPLRQTFRG